MYQVANQLVHRVDGLGLGAGDVAQGRPLGDFTFFADDAAEPIKFVGHPFVQFDDVVEGVGNASGKPGPVGREPDRKIPAFEGVKCR